jgi:hypothetical protein
MKNYTSAHAKRFLKMPLACLSIKIGEGRSVNYLVDKSCNYNLTNRLLAKIHENPELKTTLTRE